MSTVSQKLNILTNDDNSVSIIIVTDKIFEYGILKFIASFSIMSELHYPLHLWLLLPGFETLPISIPEGNM